MDEYIKREDALDAVLFALAGAGYQRMAIRVIRDVPTADVAPRAEVAREIFEEIDKLTFVRGFGGAVPNLVIMTKKDYAELKKKYMEEKK